MTPLTVAVLSQHHRTISTRPYKAGDNHFYAYCYKSANMICLYILPIDQLHAHICTDVVKGKVTTLRQIKIFTREYLKLTTHKTGYWAGASHSIDLGVFEQWCC